MNEVLNLLGVIGVGLFIVHNLLFFYLEITNNHFKFPPINLPFEIFTYYNKTVKPHQKNIVKIADLTLKYGAIAFLFCIIIVVFQNFT